MTRIVTFRPVNWWGRVKRRVEMMPVPILTENHDGTKFRTKSPNLVRCTAPCRSSCAIPALAKKPARSLRDSGGGSIASKGESVIAQVRFQGNIMPNGDASDQ